MFGCLGVNILVYCCFNIFCWGGGGLFVFVGDFVGFFVLFSYFVFLFWGWVVVVFVFFKSAVVCLMFCFAFLRVFFFRVLFLWGLLLL